MRLGFYRLLARGRGEAVGRGWWGRLKLGKAEAGKGVYACIRLKPKRRRGRQEGDKEGDWLYDS